MIRNYFFFFLLILSIPCTAQADMPTVVNFEGLKPYLQKNNDTIYVVNFWATWCKPCIEELPYIEQLHQDQFDNPVNVILVSLDFINQIEDKLIPFIQEYKLKSTIVVLDDPDANSWIDKIDSRWSGAIPATFIYQKEKRMFFPDSFEDYSSLKSVINSF